MINRHTLFRILKAVDYSETISDIAAHLYISQPYISKLLKEVENIHHVTLVDRKTKPIHLTAAGNTMLTGLQAIFNEEELLNERLRSSAKIASRPIKIIVTDPFSSEMVSEAMALYYAAHSEHRINIIFSNYTRADTDNIDHSVDVLVGKELTDQHFQTIPLTTQELCLFISKNCSGFNPDQCFVPLLPDTLTQLNQSHFVGLSGFDSFQQYVELSFKKEGLQLINAVMVPTPMAALKAVNHITGSTTITTATMAESVYPDHGYNLIRLPENFINLHSVINYRDATDGLADHIARYLARYFTIHLGTPNTSNSSM